MVVLNTKLPTQKMVPTINLQVLPLDKTNLELLKCFSSFNDDKIEKIKYFIHATNTWLTSTLYQAPSYAFRKQKWKKNKCSFFALRNLKQ